MKNNEGELLMYLYAAGIVIFGAIVHSTNQFKLARTNKTPWTFLDFMILLPMSIFAGAMFGLIASLLSENTTHLFIACGVGSFLGIAGLNAISERILNSFLKKYESNDS